MKLPKELVLNYRTWVCGVPTEGFHNGRVKNSCHGSGDTNLLNSNGHMCCLGQFAKQAGCINKQILTLGTPQETDVLITGLTKYRGSFLSSSLLISITIILFGTPI